MVLHQQISARALAYDFASANKLALPPNRIKNGKVGEDLWSGFKKRH